MLNHLSGFAVAIALAAYVLAIAIGASVLAIAQSRRGTGRRLDRDFAVFDDVPSLPASPAAGGVKPPSGVAPPPRLASAEPVGRAS